MLVCSKGQGCWQGRYGLLELGSPPCCPRAWLNPVVVTRVWMYTLVLGIFFCDWEASIAAIPLHDNRIHSWLFLSCLIPCEGRQDPYMCPGTTKSLQELFGRGCTRLFGDGDKTAETCQRVGRVVITAVSQGLEQSLTVLCSTWCPVSFKDLLGCKRFLLYLTGNHSSREVPPMSAVALALPGQGGFEDEAATSLYLVCWKSEQVL